MGGISNSLFPYFVILSKFVFNEDNIILRGLDCGDKVTNMVSKLPQVFLAN